MPHVTEEDLVVPACARVAADVVPWPEAGDDAEAVRHCSGSRRRQHMFRCSGPQRQLEGDEKRILRCCLRQARARAATRERQHLNAQRARLHKENRARRAAACSTSASSSSHSPTSSTRNGRSSKCTGASSTQSATERLASLAAAARRVRARRHERAARAAPDTPSAATTVDVAGELKGKLEPPRVLLLYYRSCPRARKRRVHLPVRRRAGRAARHGRRRFRPGAGSRACGMLRRSARRSSRC